MNRVYLDWNASAPLRPEARAAMLAAMDVVGNPSSVHAEGRAAKAIVEKARGQVARLTGWSEGELVFNSGATEGANEILAHRQAIMARTEHDCVFRHFDPGWALPSDESGRVVIDERFDATILGGLRDGEMIAIQWANSETGVINDVGQCFDYIQNRNRSAEIFVDATQGVGKLNHDTAVTLADFGIASAHKLSGPTGVGAQLCPFGWLPAVGHESGQENSRRAGTENVIGIAGFGAAAEAAQLDQEDGVWDRVADLRDRLEDRLASEAPDLIVFGKDVPRLPNTSCFAVPGWKGETQVMQMDLAGYAISAGSACSSGKVNKASRVLLAMGFDEETASSAIRVSMGPTTTQAEVMGFAETWIDNYRRRKERAA
ncbi:MAG: aminotransferase class V-fold PLP-dependent enzyme [Paracoccaceae bacterium]|nr:aminotransferase class V-fold PLP-dependent enzyme [Paracoccaceae bacterium]